MKRTTAVLSVFLFLSFSLSWAAPVAPDKAEQCARKWMELQGATNLVGGAVFLRPGKTIKAPGDVDWRPHDSFYVVNVDPAGYVVVAWDDVAHPILFYSKEGQYTGMEMPPQFVEMMQVAAQDIAAAIGAKRGSQKRIASTWELLLETNAVSRRTDAKLLETSVAPLMSVTWNQGRYYNQDCPADASGQYGHALAGCTAVAMAQVMRHHRHPARGIGSHSYYHSDYGTLSASFGSTTYNWNSMPTTLGSYDGDVAELIYHCGVSLEMDYGPDGSFASCSDIPAALVNYFGYQSGVSIKWRSSYSSANWCTLLINELEAGRPVVYRSSGSGGHAFNIDGYQGIDYFHVNWGWGGAYNGYFYLNDMTPGSHEFNDSQAAVIGIEPDQGSGPSLSYHSHIIDDDNSGGSDGNGDGQANPGEEIELPVTLINTGSESAHDVQAILTTSDPYVTITDDDRTWGTISAGDTDESIDFDFDVASGCPHGHVIHFNLAISADEGNWNDSFTVTVYGSGSSDDAYEQNDTRTTAYDFTSEQTWLSTIGGLGMQSDDDWYEIDVSPSGYERVQVNCRFTDSDGDIDIQLVNSSGTVLASSTSTSDNEFIDYVVPSAGTYYIRVYYANAGNTYDLWWDDLQPPAPGTSVPADFNGNMISDRVVFRPSGGLWDLHYSGGGSDTLAFGWSAVKPVPADYDGDRVTDVAVYHPASGNWYIRPSGGGGDYAEAFGWSAAIPLPGDYDGDGIADLAVFHQKTARWYFRMSSGGADSSVAFGWSSVIPVPADYDGDGAVDVAVYHPASGNWYVSESSTGDVLTVPWGWSSAIPVPADYDGDGRADIAVFHRKTATWYIRYSGGGDWVGAYGWSSVVPVPADYDGDGRADITVYHPAGGQIYIRRSTTGVSDIRTLGGSGWMSVLLYPLIHSWFRLP